MTRSPKVFHTMYEDIYVVFDDIRSPAVDELIRRAADAVYTHDETLLKLLAKIRNFDDISPEHPLTPEEIVTALHWIIKTPFSDRPLSWHLHRVLHINKFRLSPDYDFLHSAINKFSDLEPAIMLLAGEHEPGFLYTDLCILPDMFENNRDQVLKHVEAHLNLEAIRFLMCSWIDVSTLPMPLVKAGIHLTLTAIMREAQASNENPNIWVLPEKTNIKESVQRFFTECFSRPDALMLLHGYTGPIVSVVEGPCNVESLERCIVMSVYKIRLPPDADIAIEQLCALVVEYPQITSALAYLMGQIDSNPSPTLIQKAARVCPEFFVKIRENKWPLLLEGQADLIQVAASISDINIRAEVLIEIGRPAADQLAKLVTADLKELTEDDLNPPSETVLRIRRIADMADSLELGWWKKRLEHPTNFVVLWGSQRLRAGFTLDTAPLLRLLRKSTQDQQARNIGFHILHALLYEGWEILREAGDTATTLINSKEVEQWFWAERVALLESIGTPDARALATSLIPKGDLIEDRERYISWAIKHDPFWQRLLEAGKVNFKEIIQEIGSVPVGLVAAQSVVDWLVTNAVDTNEEETHAVMAILEQHGRLLGRDRITALKKRFTQSPKIKHMISSLRRHTGSARLPWVGLLEADMGCLSSHIGRWLANQVMLGYEVPFQDVAERAVRARCREALGIRAEVILGNIGPRWPTRSTLIAAAAATDVVLDDATLDRCADECIPILFRAAISRLPIEIEEESDIMRAQAHGILSWVIEKLWVHSPELVARHLVPELSKTSSWIWRRWVVLALVALRESCGTTVPDALTAAMHVESNPENKEFLLAQRNSFTRKSMAIEQSLPAEVRTRQALFRLRKGARLAKLA